MLLHGDLHHFNFLAAQRSPWLAIDPKGIIGDPIFEVAAFICNPYPVVIKLPNLKELLQRRIELFHELLGYNKQRIRDWSIAHSILAASQNLTSHGEGNEFLHIGKILLTLDV